MAEFDFWDYNESVRLRHAFGFGSNYDTNKIGVWLCAACADKLMDIALPLFKEDPLEHYEDLPPTTYTEEEAKGIEEYIKAHTKFDETVSEDFDVRYEAAFGDDSQQSLTVDEFKDKMQKIIDFK